MNLPTLIVLLAVLAALAAALIFMGRRKTPSGCGSSSCTGCALADSCRREANNR